MATNWFPHDAAAHNDQRILLVREKYGWQGYGLFWAVLEAMYETVDGKLDTDVLRALYVRFSVEQQWLLEFIQFCVSVNLFAEENGTIFSERLVLEKTRMLEKSEQAKRAIEIRWNKRNKKRKNTDVSRPNNEGNTPPHPTQHTPPNRIASDDATVKPLQDHLVPLAVFTVCSKPRFDNVKQLDAWIVRHSRTSKRLMSFTPRQIATAFAYAVYERDEKARKDGRGYDISLETVEKKIFDHKDDVPGGQYERQIATVLGFFENNCDLILSSRSPFLAP